MDEILKRLDQIIALLELQTFGPEPGECIHEHKTDLSTMGERPGTRVQCNDCGAMIERN